MPGKQPTREATRLKKPPPSSATAEMEAELAVADAPPSEQAELGARLHALLSAGGAETAEFESELRRLEALFGATVYTELIYQLSHLSFESKEARRHWRQILEHQGLLQERMGSFVDLRVALTSYFLQVTRQLDNPILIEMQLFEQTQAMAYRDQLTGLRNYRFFSEHLPQEIARSDQYGAPLSLILIDIDDFKRYNDRHGHETGNHALAAIGGLLRAASRRVDIAARYGGEEFALILPSTPKVGARLLAERIRGNIESHPFRGEETQPEGKLTVSMGIATYPGDATSPAELVRRADRAMYHSKTEGKNQVRLYGENRRSYRRITTSLEGSLSLYATERYALTTVDISEGGVRFVSEQAIVEGALVDVNLRLPEPEGAQVSMAARVVKVREGRSGECDVAVRIIDITAPDQRLLASYIRAQARRD